jgi:putative SOS response-associated peptidase YedK
MCGRYTLIKLSDFLEYFPWIEMTNLITAARYNNAPSQEVAAITNHHQPHPQVELLRWGLVPAWAKDASISAGSRMINARAETLASKPSFARLLKRQHCLIPASGFYEWQKNPHSKEKIPYYFRLKDGHPFAFAGLWDCWHAPHGKELRTCTIITTAANAMLAGMHDRMPVILKNEAEMMETYAVSDSVNSPRHDGPEQIVKVEPSQPVQPSLFPDLN